MQKPEPIYRKYHADNPSNDGLEKEMAVELCGRPAARTAPVDKIGENVMYWALNVDLN